MADKISLIVLPGLLCDGALWRYQIDALSDIADITVADLTRENQFGPMAQRILASAPETFALAGLSMGGYLAFEIMRQAPDRVRRLALLDTSPYEDSHEQTARRRGLIELARKGDFKGVTRRLLPLLVHPSRLRDTVLTQTVFDMADRVGRDAFVRQQAAIMTRPDSLHDLGLIHCPTLVLCGRSDALTPLALHQEMAAAIPHASLTVVEDAGHLSPLERPDVVNAAMRAWLEADEGAVD